MNVFRRGVSIRRFVWRLCSISPCSSRFCCARKLVRRIIDLLVIIFIAAVGLTLGRQLIEWWRMDSSAVTSPVPLLSGIDFDWSRAPITMQFGDAETSIQRTPFQGDRKRLNGELIRIARSIVVTSKALVQPPDLAETEWLALLRKAPAVFWDLTMGSVYLRQDPLPSFVATRFIESAGNEHEIVQRIIGWGLAFPSESGGWTIYSFCPDASGSGEISPEFPLVIPEGSRRLTRMRDAHGCQWLLIQGRGDLASWVQQFEDSFGKNAVVSKSVGVRSASMKYRTTDLMADVQLQSESADVLSGVIWFTRTRSLVNGE